MKRADLHRRIGRSDHRRASTKSAALAIADLGRWRSLGAELQALGARAVAHTNINHLPIAAVDRVADPLPQRQLRGTAAGPGGLRPATWDRVDRTRDVTGSPSSLGRATFRAQRPPLSTLGPTFPLSSVARWDLGRSAKLGPGTNPEPEHRSRSFGHCATVVVVGTAVVVVGAPSSSFGTKSTSTFLTSTFFLSVGPEYL